MTKISLSLPYLLLALSCINSGMAESAAFNKRSHAADATRKALCRKVPHPKLCIQYLSIFPNSQLQDTYNITKAAFLVSLYRARYTRSYMLKQLHSSKVKEIPGYLQACLEQLGSGVIDLSDSIKELSHLENKERVYDDDCNISCHIFNIKINLSAVMTDADTCVDEYPNTKIISKLKATIKAKVLNVGELTINALDLFCRLTGDCS